MDPKYILEALLHLWDDFPFLLGMEAWSRLYREIEPLLRKLQEARTEGEKALAGADVVLAFADYPAAQQRLAQAVEHIRTERSSSSSPREALPWERLLAAFDSLIHPQTATRYTDIHAPRRIQRGKRAPLTVALTVGPEAESRESEALTVKAGRSIDISLRSLSSGLEVVSAPLRRLWIRPGGDSPPAAFVFKGTALGRQVLSLDFHQKGRHVGHVELPVEVIREIPADEEIYNVAGPVFGERPVPQPVDLEITVSIERRDGGMRFYYELHSPNGIVPFNKKKVAGPEILVDVERYRAALMTRLEKLQERRGEENERLLKSEIPDKLAGLGRDLYRELFDGEMRTFYRRFRDPVKSIQIFTEDPWIPWEILQPYDDSDPDPARLVDDDFLCCRFQVTRWLAGSRVPAGEVCAAQLACVEVGKAPGLPALPYAGAERQILTDLAVAHGLRDASPALVGAERLKGLLSEGGNQILHFVAHGDFSAERPDASSLHFADGSFFRAGDLHGPLATRLSQDRPLVFLNSCRLGQQGWALTGLDGWARRWVRDAGCGAFVAPLWAVSDRLAFELAKAFYAALEAGETFGTAAQAARLRVREIAGDNPSWMAYAIYAHPHGRLVLASEEALSRAGGHRRGRQGSGRMSPGGSNQAP